VEVNLETVRGVGVLELLGETLDMSEVDDLRQQLTTLAASNPKLVLDLNRIQFLDSSGCGALVEGHNRFRYDTREQALAAFGS